MSVSVGIYVKKYLFLMDLLVIVSFVLINVNELASEWMNDWNDNHIRIIHVAKISHLYIFPFQMWDYFATIVSTHMAG